MACAASRRPRTPTIMAHGLMRMLSFLAALVGSGAATCSAPPPASGAATCNAVIDVALVVDNSASVQNVTSDITTFLSNFVSTFSSADGKAQFALVSFGTDAVLQVSLTSETSQVLEPRSAQGYLVRTTAMMLHASWHHAHCTECACGALNSTQCSHPRDMCRALLRPTSPGH